MPSIKSPDEKEGEETPLVAISQELQDWLAAVTIQLELRKSGKCQLSFFFLLSLFKCKFNYLPMNPDKLPRISFCPRWEDDITKFSAILFATY